VLAAGSAACYILGMSRTVLEILRRVEHWPREDREELAEAAREIEARRTAINELSDEERAAIEEAIQSGLASEEEVAAFWKRHGIPCRH
jgi:hypothetical protein